MNSNSTTTIPPQSQPPSLRPDAKTFVPSSLQQSQKNQQPPQRFPSSSSTCVINTRGVKQPNRQHRNTKDHHNQYRRRTVQAQSNDSDNNKDNIIRPEALITSKLSSSSSSSRRRRRRQKNHRSSQHDEKMILNSEDHLQQSASKQDHISSEIPKRRKHRRSQQHQQHQKSQQQQQQQLITNTSLDDLEEIGKDDVSLQLTFAKNFPSLRVSSTVQNDGDLNDSFPALLLRNEEFVTDLPVKTLHSTEHRSKNRDNDDTIWSKFKLIQEPSDMMDVDKGNSANQDGTSDITQMITLHRNPCTTVVIVDNTVQSKHGTRDAECRSCNTLPNNNNNNNNSHTDHQLLYQVSRRQQQPSIDKLRDRWWNLVVRRDHVGQPDEIAQEIVENELNRGDDDFSGDTRIDPITEKPNGLLSTSSSVVDDLNYAAVEQMECSFDSDHYLKELMEGIQCSDTDRVRYLLSKIPDDINLVSIKSQAMCGDCTSILDWAVHLNNVQMLRFICARMDTECISELYVPLLMATERSYDECIQVLLSYFGVSSLLSCRDVQGNTALHISCLSTVHRTTFPVLLDCIITSTGYTKSLLFKILSSRNHQQQTPLHVAAQCKRADVIDLALSHRCTSTVSMLTKLFALQDMERQTPLLAAVASDCTDIVMSLQMWRGNNQQLKQLAPTARNCLEKDKISIPCPLAWAVQHKNVDMVSLLLEFNNPFSESGYRLKDALCVAVMNTIDVDGTVDDDNTSLDIIRILVAAGANPCTTDIDDKESNNAITLAAIHGKPERLARLMYSYDEYLCQIRLQRRQDPKLQRQPESFFLGMESAENTERFIAGKEALLRSLFMIRSRGSSEYIDRRRKCCVVLYEQGIQLAPCDLVQLKLNMNLDFVPVTTYTATYQRMIMPSCSATSIHDKEQRRYYWSHVMSVLPWFEYNEAQKCAFFTSAHRIGNMCFDLTELQQPDVIIKCNDGSSLLAHRIVLGQSQKLHAAIRFASMRDEHRHDESTTCTMSSGTITLEVDLTYHTCRQLLVHMYHGSTLDELSTDPQECCLQILELILVADEYICISLIHECILRLLASVDMYDRCFCSYCQHSNENCATTCIYHVTGPSHLITADLVLDVLAIAQHVNWCPDSSDNNDNHMQRSRTTKQKKMLVDYLREVALSVAICDFRTVLRSPTFINQFDNATTSNETYDPSTARGMLLTSLLNDLLEVGRLS